LEFVTDRQLALHLGDQQLQVLDQSLGAGQLGTRLDQHSLQRIVIVRNMIGCRRHNLIESQSPMIRWSSQRSLNKPYSTSRRWPPAVLWMAPVDTFEQIAELCRRDCHRAIRGLGPDEAATLQPFGVERHAKTVMPENLDQLAVLAAEHVEIAAVRVTLERFLNRQGQRVHAAAHVGMVV
jgi:hypothetical protein